MIRCALYARYSTAMQREQSISDQFRVCEKLAERHGFRVTERFFDKALSGGTSQRPSYQRMLLAARRKEFDCIVAEDTSRLWRNLAEQSPRLAELSDLGIAVVTQDLDTRHESAEIMGAVGGAMASAYRKEIGRRVRRGLEGLARDGKSAGGRSYGYIPAAKSGTKQIEIDSSQAKVVRRIFQMYANGYSPRAIADALNGDNIPSPGADWGREQRRKSGWVGSAIHGNPDRGLGILNNPLYRGSVIWNRSKWVRSAADSSKRKQIQNPQSAWIARQDERLRIVSEDLWGRVRARQSHHAELRGIRVKRGLSKAAAGRTGAGPKYLCSGLLQCGACGSGYVIVGRDIYGCSSNVNGGDALCANDARLHRLTVEAELLAGIKSTLSSPAAVTEICKRARALLRKPKAAPRDDSARIAQLGKEIDNIANAIASGMMHASAALGARLLAAETELQQLEQIKSATMVSQGIIPRVIPDLETELAEMFENFVETLASGDVPRSREEIKRHVGPVTVEADDKEIRLLSDNGHLAAALLRSSGSHAIKFGSGGAQREFPTSDTPALG